MASISVTGGSGNIPTTSTLGGINRWRYPIGRPTLTAPASQPAGTYQPAPLPQQPAAPPAPSTSPYWDAQKAFTTETANRNYDQYITDTNLDLQRVGQSYGFNAQGALDPSNPYSQAALLQRAYQQQQEQIARNREQLGYDYGQGVAEVGRGREQVGYDYTQGVGEVGRNREELGYRYGQNRADVGRQREELGYQHGQRTGQLGRNLQELLRQFQVAQRGNVNSMAARGQLYSGALTNAQAETERIRGEGEAEIGRERADVQRRFGLDTKALGRREAELARYFGLDTQALGRRQAELERAKKLGTGALDRRQAELARFLNLGTGQLDRAGTEATFGYNQGYDALRRAFDDFLIQWNRGRRGAGQQRTDVIGQAGLNALAGALGA